MQTKKVALFILLSGLWLNTRSVQAQDEAAEVIKSGISNANALAKAYSAPLSKAFGTDLNTGWLTTGKAFKTGRFEVRLFANAAFVPQKDQTFDLTTIGLNSNVRLAAGENKMAPTVFGSDNDGPLLKIYGTRPDTKQEVELASLNTPSGINSSVAPIPMAQVNVGIIKETELMVRFIPKKNIGDFNVNMWGVGLKHSLRQWIPVVSALPFDITAAAAYTSFASDYALDFKPEQGVANPNPADYTTQKVTFDTKAFNAMLVVSKTLAVITGYAGLNYSRSTTTTGMIGNYPITSIDEQNPSRRKVQHVSDPLLFDVKYQQLGLTGGLRLKLAFFSLNAEGTLATYPTASAGIGLGFN